MKTVLITGASRGIGKACALRFASAGYYVIVNYRTNREAAEATVSEIKSSGGSAVCFAADVSDSAQVSQMRDQIKKLGLSVDVLVNNAGTADYSLFQDMTDGQWTEIRRSLDGAVFCTRAFLPDMLSAHNGSIVNVSSVWGITGASCEAAYSAVKAGIIGLTRALAKETGPSGVRVNCIAPGCVDTDMCSKLDHGMLSSMIPLGRLASPQEIAGSVLFLAEAPYITGAVLSADGGFGR